MDAFISSHGSSRTATKESNTLEDSISALGNGLAVHETWSPWLIEPWLGWWHGPIIESQVQF